MNVQNTNETIMSIKMKVKEKNENYKTINFNHFISHLNSFFSQNKFFAASLCDTILQVSPGLAAFFYSVL